jgi:hypothetical protein
MQLGNRQQGKHVFLLFRIFYVVTTSNSDRLEETMWGLLGFISNRSVQLSVAILLDLIRIID